MNTFYKILLAAVIAFVLLKLTGIITISWWWMFGPLFFLCVLIFIVWLLVDFLLHKTPEDPGF